MKSIESDIIKNAIETDYNQTYTQPEMGIGVGIEEDVENEDDDEFSTYPFNPEEISIDTRLVTMETLLRRLSQGSIRLNPDFQRNEVWTDEKKSRLIESIMLKIPLPMFYVSSDEKSNWAVVDGLQRISAFRDFILGKEFLQDSKKNSDKRYHGIILKGLEYWKSLDGKQMFELPENLFNRILEAEFTFTIINPGTHEEVKRNIFKRINTGGEPLSQQEIRNALYTGDATQLLKRLSGLAEFKKATDNSIRAQRLEDHELVLRLVAFILRNPSTYKKTQNIDSWLSNSMIILNGIADPTNREYCKCVKKGIIREDDIRISTFEEIENFFKKAMVRASKIFGKHAFRKSMEGMRRRPINKSLFETWGLLLSQMDESNFNLLYKNRKMMFRLYEPLLNDDSFITAISRDSMKHGSVSLRFNKIQEIITDTLHAQS